MNRVPNPPKAPIASAAQTRAGLAAKVRGGVATAVAMSLGFLDVTTAQAAEDGVAALSAATAPSTAGADRPASSPEQPSIVVLGAGPARSLVIREHAEAMRREAFAKLLGMSAPPAWSVCCEIHVHATADAFADAIGGPPVDARGATSLEFAGERVVFRRIDVMGDGPGEIPDALDHELVHVVLADHFVHGPPPRWADEGLALLFDDPAKQRKHAADLQAAARRGLAWSPADLVALEEYPTDGGRQRVFYGQSAAVVRWLVARRDASTFIRFLDDADAFGIEAALRRHYDLDSLDSLSTAWKEVAPINSLGRAELRRGLLP